MDNLENKTMEETVETNVEETRNDVEINIPAVGTVIGLALIGSYQIGKWAVKGYKAVRKKIMVKKEARDKDKPIDVKATEVDEDTVED